MEDISQNITNSNNLGILFLVENNILNFDEYVC